MRNQAAQTSQILASLGENRTPVSASSRALVHVGDHILNLHKAARMGDVSGIEKLLHNPAVDINARDVDGCTPLHLTSTAEAASKLLSLGCSKDAEDKEGRTALQ